MLSKQSINVCLVSDLFNNYHLTDSTIVVVVDLLRATSVISTAFHYGIKEIIPVSSVADAKKFLNKILIVFFCLVSPISRKENPRCIKNTNAVHIIIHTLLTVNNSMILI